LGNEAGNNYSVMEKNIHIGYLIKEKVKERKLHIVDFAKALHCDRSNIYDIFERKCIDVELLIRISKILDYNFLSIYYEREVRFDFDPENDKNYKLIIEIKSEKIQELISDKSVKIIELYEM
jgi:transcriptional regulator with XRE-family HTH domain